MEKTIIDSILEVLDAQLANYIKAGARFCSSRAPWFCVSGGNEPQNTFYQGNISMAEATVIAAYPGRNACITVDRHGKHMIAMEG
jgi:hypothetical protein